MPANWRVYEIKLPFTVKKQLLAENELPFTGSYLENFFFCGSIYLAW